MAGGAWLYISLVLLVIAVALQQLPLLLVAILFFLASGVARLWARYALDRVEYVRHLRTTRVLFGETITLEVSLANRKILPLPWLRVEDEVPEEVTFLKGKTWPSHNPARNILSSGVSLSWYQRLTRRYPVQCLRRGYFSFGPASIRTGDLFGWFRKETLHQQEDHLLVYPRVVPLEELGIPSRHPFGDLRVRRHLFEDPVLVSTTRDYVYGDPLRRIHWKSSARVQRLQSRVFEPTTTVDLGLFLDVRTVEPPFYGQLEQRLETAIIAAASIANYATQEGYRIGLYVNEPYRRSARLVRLPPSEHPDQLQRVLEALAQLRGWPFPELERLLSREARSLPWSTTLVVITAVPRDPLITSLLRFRRAGRRVALILVGKEAAHTKMDGLTVYHISDQIYWRELTALRLGGQQGGRRSAS